MAGGGIDRHAGRGQPLSAGLVDPDDVGRKAVAQNAADIEAMGARATAFVVGFGAPPETAAAQVNALADGMWDEAARVGASIVGGDRSPARNGSVSVTVLGDLAGRAPVLRSGARPGSQLAVAGQLRVFGCRICAVAQRY